MKTNNLDKENKIKVKYPEIWSMLKELYKIAYDSATDKSNADRPDYSYYYEKIETYIINREKALREKIIKMIWIEFAQKDSPTKRELFKRIEKKVKTLK